MIFERKWVQVMSEKEECHYCWGNADIVGPCPVCGAVKSLEDEKSESPPSEKPEFYSGKLLDLLTR